ncbi:MAG: hypothetical protein ACKVT0_22720 [Planctomycetaceae bacterium]
MKGNVMSIKGGVWIDHHKAVVVLMKDGGEEIRQIESDVDKPFASAGGPGSKQPDRHNGYMPEDKQEHRYMNQLNTYYDEVLSSLSGTDSLLILGPGEAKGEFQKRLKYKKFPVHFVELETADKMSDRQVTARIRQHFEEA